MIWRLIAAVAVIVVGMPVAANAASPPESLISKLDNLQLQIDNLQGQIDTIELIVGPEGPPGPPGAGAEGSFGLFALGPDTQGNITAEEWNRCATEQGGRPANSKDVLTHPWHPASPQLIGWVWPYIVAADPGFGSKGSVTDISGVTKDRGALVCAGGPTQEGGPWSSALDGTGLITKRGGVAGRLACHFDVPIVCLVPLVP